MLSILQNPHTMPLIFGHRGACEEYPENTIMSFDMAIKQGAIGVETDLRFSKDMKIVCFHDQYLNRLSSSRGRIDQMTLKELSKVKIQKGSIFPQPIPTLFDLLEWCPNENFLILELKDSRFNEEGNLNNLLNILVKYNIAHKTILSSFSTAVLLKIKKIYSSMLTNLVTFSNFVPTSDADMTTPLYPILWLNPSYIQRAHNINKYVTTWDPHPEIRMQYYLTHKMDLITGDNPRKIIESMKLLLSNT